MKFYFPLRLGLRRQRAAAPRKEQDGRPNPQVYEAWREGADRSLTDYEESPEAQVLKAICHSAPSQSLTFILGEPGAGKTTLFLDWFLRLARDTAAGAPLGAKLPVLVRMRSVPAEIWTKNNEADLADALWEHARKERAILEPQDEPGRSAESHYTLDARHARVFSPVWLFDGLDEVPKFTGREHFYQKLASLPGQKAVSSRIAVYQSLRGVTERYKWRDYEILALRPVEQQAFLVQALRMMGDWDADARSKSLAAEIRRNAAVRVLAGNPMMLELMAQSAIDGEEALVLPGSRARFYAESINHLWHRKLIDDPDALRNRKERDQFLGERAASMELDTLRAPLPELAPDLDRGLRNSGLVRVDDIHGTFEFLHLTLQEFYLARHLKTTGLRAALERYWSNARYQETLGLLVSLLFEEKRYQEIEDGIQWLVQWGAEAHRKDPNTLWRIWRSPTRTALHLIARAGITLKFREFDKLLGSRWLVLAGARRRRRRSLMKLAMAMDFWMPPELLARLAEDQDAQVRKGVAGNASTPPELLTRLAEDQDAQVREGVAGNASTPPELLARLTEDQDAQVREGVAGNASTPPEVLARLAAPVGEKASASSELLVRLAIDVYNDRRAKVAGNASTPPELLARLADENRFLRHHVAGNASTPPELLARLAADQDSYVRHNAAGNASTPPELLARLAEDQDSYVRHKAAGNASTPPELLVPLAADQDSSVRENVAINARTPPELLARLAADRDGSVRQGVARNVSTPPELLVRLAADRETRVREGVARNVSTPPELLVRLAADQDSVRWGVASNASTPPEALARLAADKDYDVRGFVAGNPRLLLEDLL